MIRSLFQTRTARQKSKEKLTDSELILQYCKNEDQECIVLLLSRYTDQITGMCYNYFRNSDDVKDFTSELFMKLCSKLKQIDPHEIRNVNAWLYTYIKHRILDQLRKVKTYNEYKSEFGKQSVHISSESRTMPALDKEELMRGISSLSSNEKLCVELIYLQELSYQEIMEAYGFSFNQVRGFRDRGIAKLKTVLKDEFETYFNYP